MESREKTRVLQVRFRGAKDLIIFFLNVSYVVLAAKTALSESASSHRYRYGRCITEIMHVSVFVANYFQIL